MGTNTVEKQAVGAGRLYRNPGHPCCVVGDDGFKARTRGSCARQTEGQAVSINQRGAVRNPGTRLNGVAPDDLSGRFEQEARVEQRGN